MGYQKETSDLIRSYQSKSDSYKAQVEGRKLESQDLKNNLKLKEQVIVDLEEKKEELIQKLKKFGSEIKEKEKENHELILQLEDRGVKERHEISSVQRKAEDYENQIKKYESEMQKLRSDLDQERNKVTNLRENYQSE